jgi:hypothetical protein
MVKYDGIQEPQFMVLLLKIKIYHDPTFFEVLISLNKFKNQHK